MKLFFEGVAINASENNVDLSSKKPPIGSLVTLAVIGIAMLIAYAIFVWLPKKKQETIVRLDLFAVALQFHDYSTTHGRSPQNLEELKSHKPTNMFSANRKPPTVAYRMIEEGELTVIWGAQFSEDGNKNDEYVLGYEAQTPDVGGLVLLGGGTVEFMTADKFKQMALIPVSEPD